ncbi:MAG: HD domain-containing protein [Chloroflexi bacterium]|nr:HD domain-containing protein [Chloroflexota bacterium]
MSNENIKVLVIEDNPADAHLIGEMMEEYAPGGLDLKYTDTLSAGMEMLSQSGFSAVLLDLGLPDSKGLGTLTKMLAKFPGLPVIVLTGLADDSTGIEAVKCGAQDYIAKGQINWRSIYSAIRYAIERKEMAIHLQKSLDQQRTIVKGAVEALVGMIEMRDPPNAEHQKRVAHLAALIAERMGYPQDRVEFVRTAALLHDLGKSAVPTEILNKPGKLEGLELSLQQAHVQASYDVLKGIEFPWPVAEVVLQHHERIDGSGYPQGLDGDRILQEAKILIVAEVMDGMCTYRAWRPDTPGCGKALEEISEGRGKLYDAAVVDACMSLFTEKEYKLE